MTDIVERLLEQSKCVSRSELSPAITGLCSEAAYEIERLRAALRIIADMQNQMDELRRRVDVLRRTLMMQCVGLTAIAIGLWWVI